MPPLYVSIDHVPLDKLVRAFAYFVNHHATLRTASPALASRVRSLMRGHDLRSESGRLRFAASIKNVPQFARLVGALAQHSSVMHSGSRARGH